jgi:hypothetical protein
VPSDAVIDHGADRGAPTSRGCDVATNSVVTGVTLPAGSAATCGTSRRAGGCEDAGSA